MSLFSPKKKPVDIAPDPALVAKVRAYLIGRYEQRLSQKMGGRQPVNLRMLPSLAGTSKESAENYITLQEEEVRAAIGDIFDRANGRLLLVGLPGAGKTTLVLQLALHLLENQRKSIPIILNLATWHTDQYTNYFANSFASLYGTRRAEFKTFDEWLSKILPIELGASQALAEQIRKNTPLILLLDGLDEMPEADRTSCLLAIGEYGVDAKQQFLISSRIAEYAATKDAPVNVQVEVAQLTIEQVEVGLLATAHIHPESKRLLNALKSDPLLRQAVENPFYLNTAQLLFASGRNWSEFRFVATDVAGRQRELVEQFVEGTLAQTDKYPADKARHWLSFLASRMTQRNMVVFELRDLQYDWWRWSNRYLKLAETIGVLTEKLAVILVFGASFGLMFALPVGFTVGLSTGLLVGIITGLGSILMFMIIIPITIPKFMKINALKIVTKDKITTSWHETARFFIGGFIIITILFTITSVFMALFNWLIDKDWNKMFLAMLFGLPFVLCLALLITLEKILSEYSGIIQISTPYQRFTASSKSFHFSILQHKFLYYSLKNQALVPSNFVSFLNEMSYRHLLETDGATWRFRHRILQDYFAGLWVEGER